MPDPNAIGSALMKLLEGSSNQAMDWGASALGNTLAMPGDLAGLIQAAGGQMPLGMQAVGKGAGLLDEFLRGGGLTEPLMARADALREKNPAYGYISALPPAGKTLGKGKLFSMEKAKEAKVDKYWQGQNLFAPGAGVFPRGDQYIERNTFLNAMRQHGLGKEADKLEEIFPAKLIDKFHVGTVRDMVLGPDGMPRIPEYAEQIPVRMHSEDWLSKAYGRDAFTDPYGRSESVRNSIIDTVTPGESRNARISKYKDHRELRGADTPIDRSHRDSRPAQDKIDLYMSRYKERFGLDED